MLVAHKSLRQLSKSCIFHSCLALSIGGLMKHHNLGGVSLLTQAFSQVRVTFRSHHKPVDSPLSCTAPTVLELAPNVYLWQKILKLELSWGTPLIRNQQIPHMTLETITPSEHQLFVRKPLFADSENPSSGQCHSFTNCWSSSSS